MKQRHRKRLILKRMATKPFSYDYEGMYHIRYIKPCKSYNAWCSDCNAVLFRQAMGRFPYTYAEFADYENEQQKGKTL